MTEQQTKQAGRPPRSPVVRPWIAGGGLHRTGANLVAVAVGAIAGYISWLHLYALGMSQPVTDGLSADQEKLAAGLTPFSIDGMILVGTLKLRAARLDSKPAHWAAYLAVVLGVGLTMAGNIASAPDAFWAQVLAAAPPAAFLVSVEVLAGKPLTRNLWDTIGAWRDQRRTAKLAKAQTKAQGQKPGGGERATTVERVAVPGPASQAPVAKTRRANDRPGSPQREASPVPTVADPQPDNTPDTAEPVSNPQPQQPPAERPAAEPDDRTPHAGTPRMSPSRRRVLARQAAATAATDTTWARDEQGRVIGTNARPARMVDGRVLAGPELRADARRRVRDAINGGAGSKGLGTWIAGQYDPPMGKRWGQVLVAELTSTEPAEPVEGTPGIRSPEAGPAADDELPAGREPVTV